MHTAGIAIKLPTPPTQPAQLLQANADWTFLAVKLIKHMHAWILHGKKEGNIFMNINEQIVSRNLDAEYISPQC